MNAYVVRAWPCLLHVRDRDRVDSIINLSRERLNEQEFVCGCFFCNCPPISEYKRKVFSETTFSESHRRAHSLSARHHINRPHIRFYSSACTVPAYLLVRWLKDSRVRLVLVATRTSPGTEYEYEYEIWKSRNVLVLLVRDLETYNKE